MFNICIASRFGLDPFQVLRLPRVAAYLHVGVYQSFQNLTLCNSNHFSLKTHLWIHSLKWEFKPPTSFLATEAVTSVLGTPHTSRYCLVVVLWHGPWGILEVYVNISCHLLKPVVSSPFNNNNNNPILNTFDKQESSALPSWSFSLHVSVKCVYVDSNCE